ncbi:MAG: DoxX family membrane protein [Acidimicrobiales bacterium]
MDATGALGLVCQIATGALFVIAGASKVAQGRAWPVQAGGMGVPSWLAAIVPWWEIAVGAFTAVGLLAPWPAVAAALTLVAFVVLIVGQLRRGRHPQCACFGAWSSAPLGTRHVWRNAVFLAVALGAIAFSS